MPVRINRYIQTCVNYYSPFGPLAVLLFCSKFSQVRVG